MQTKEQKRGRPGNDATSISVCTHSATQQQQGLLCAVPGSLFTFGRNSSDICTAGIKLCCMLSEVVSPQNYLWSIENTFCPLKTSFAAHLHVFFPVAYHL